MTISTQASEATLISGIRVPDSLEDWVKVGSGLPQDKISSVLNLLKPAEPAT